MIQNAPKTTKTRYRQFVHGMMKTIRGALLLHDTPHRIALGTACGVSCSPLPTLGQTLIAMVLARVLGGNVVASLPWSWISNPFTTPIIWYGCYRLGMVITPGDWPLISFHQLNQIVVQFSELSLADGFATGYAIVVEIFVPLLNGSIVVGLIWGILSYFIALRWVIILQARRTARNAHWRNVPVVATSTIVDEEKMRRPTTARIEKSSAAE